MAPDLLRRVQNRICLFFFVSGATALIYEIVWVRLLSQVFGNTTHAVATVLATFMGGLGLGSYLIGRRADRFRQPVRIYGCIEIGIGVYAALTFVIVGLIEAGYIDFARRFDPGPGTFTLIRLLLSIPVLFLPTFLMGSTLPILATFTVRNREAIGSGTALLYGLNTTGAMVGTLLTGFYLLPAFGMRLTLAIAVVFNLLIGTWAILLARGLPSASGKRRARAKKAADPDVTTTDEPVAQSTTRWLLIGLFATGFLSMMLEIGWTRVLAAVLDSSTYAFTLMLGTFLLGLALGSVVYQRILARRQATVLDWGTLILIIGLSSLVTLPFLARVDLLTVRLYGLAIGHFGLLQVLRFLVCAALMFVPTFCFGALFPVSAALYMRDATRIARGLGTLYLANTIGAIFGSLGTGFILVPAIGIHHTLLLVSVIAALAGLIILYRARTRWPRLIFALAPAVLLVVIGLWGARHGWEPRQLAGGFHIAPAALVSEDAPTIMGSALDSQVLYYKEGTSCIVSVLQGSKGRALRLNGKTDATDSGDMCTQLLSGHLPHLVHPRPRRSLIIGFGSGVTLAAALTHPIEHVDCIEIEPAVFEAGHLFDHVNRGAFTDPRAELIVNDGRNHLLIEEEPYDLIISEPSNPWIAGMACLFSVDYYELVRERLAPGGILCQWIQIYSLAPRDFRMVLASVSEAFEHVTLWTSQRGDMLILASAKPISLNLQQMGERVASSPALAADLELMRVGGGGGLLGLFEMGDSDIRRFVEDAEVNTDDRLQLEFRAPLSLYEDTVALIRHLFGTYRTVHVPRLQGGQQSLNQAWVWSEIGWTYALRQQFDAARSAFDRALSLQADHVGGRLGQARCALEAGQFATALPAYEEIVAEHPDNAHARQLLGEALLRINRPAAAAQVLAEAVPLNDRRAATFDLLGQAHERQQQWHAAAGAYGRARTLRPSELGPHLSYTRALRRAGRPADAIAVLEELRRTHGAIFDVCTELRRAYEETGQRAKAIALYEERVADNPYVPGYWIALAQLYEDAGNKQQAARIVQRGRRAHPFFSEMLESERRATR